MREAAIDLAWTRIIAAVSWSRLDMSEMIGSATQRR